MPLPRLIPAALLAFWALTAAAEEPPLSTPEVAEPVIEGAPALEPEPFPDIRMPARGMTMDEVEAGFGQPSTKMPAVGEPPITRWIYPDYTVYFEHREVVHTVRNDPRDKQP